MTLLTFFWLSSGMVGRLSRTLPLGGKLMLLLFSIRASNVGDFVITLTAVSGFFPAWSESGKVGEFLCFVHGPVSFVHPLLVPILFAILC